MSMVILLNLVNPSMKVCPSYLFCLASVKREGKIYSISRPPSGHTLPLPSGQGRHGPPLTPDSDISLLLPYPIFHSSEKGHQGLRMYRRDGNRLKPLAQGLDLPRIHLICFIKYQQGGDMLNREIPDDLVHRRHLLFKAGIADVNDVDQQVRILQLIQRRPEGPEQILREFTDETDRIRDNHLALTREPQPPLAVSRVANSRSSVLTLLLVRAFSR